MSAKVEAKVSHQFAVSAERVYDAWLDPAQVRGWMSAALKSFGLSGEMRSCEIDARVGGKFLFSDIRNGVEAKHWGTYRELERPRKIVFTWIISEADEVDPSQVTLTIEDEPAGCLAKIVHQMDAKWSEYVARTEDGWGRMLTQIDAALTGTR